MEHEEGCLAEIDGLTSRTIKLMDQGQSAGPSEFCNARSDF